jgi:ubiquitin-conjugating enzyme E2 J1
VRFECFDIRGLALTDRLIDHEELWQPAWGVRTAIIGLQGFFPLKGQAAVGVGSIEYPTTERKRLAALSREWTCPHCQQTNLSLLPDPPSQSSPESSVPTTISGPVATVLSEEPVDASPTVDTPTATEPREDVTPIIASPIPSTASQAQAVHSPVAIQEATTASEEPSAPVQVAASEPTTLPPSVPAVVTQNTPRHAAHSSSQKPPVLLDTAICILLVLLFAIICRRVV